VTHDLHIRWNKIVDPQGHADTLSELLEDLKPDFQSVSYTNDFDKEQPKRRFWQSAPTYSEVGKAFESEIPTWKIGYWLDHYESLGIPDEWIPPTTGSVHLVFSVPEYKRYMVVNQSAFEYMLGHEPREFMGTDSERIDGATRLLHEALYRIGMHPGGPYPPDDFNWNLGYR